MPLLILLAVGLVIVAIQFFASATATVTKNPDVKDAMAWLGAESWDEVPNLVSLLQSDRYKYDNCMAKIASGKATAGEHKFVRQYEKDLLTVQKLREKGKL